ncbi:MAG: ABC transporter ATP-binding protein [Burkholderiales bacterium]|jgi:branched-chain amino acid transport system ATP-binding protein|nr:ABC transporter ATP-binding protein [Burkholderiales bacterium]
MNLLEVRKLVVKYGDSQVLWDLDLDVAAETITALIGANGAGKTTLLKTLTGLLSPTSGQATFDGNPLFRMPAEQRPSAGLAMVPEGRRLFAGLTVLENLHIGAYARRDAAAAKQELERVFAYFPELAEIRQRLAGNLSGGQQQMCAIGRALMSRPKLLLVDEMSLGLAPVVVDRLAETLLKISAEEGITVLLVEQDIELSFDLASSGYVLETGRIVASGPSSALRERADIREAFLGI